MKSKTVLFIVFLSIIQLQVHGAKNNDGDTISLKKEITEFVKATESVRISDFRLSPDHKMMLFITSEVNAENKSKRNIWIYNLSTKDLKRFTTSLKSDSRPRWSPDGRNIAFLSNRNKENQIYLISLNGGEAEALTESKTSIGSFEWSPDGAYIIFMSPEPDTKEKAKKKKIKDDAIVVDYDSENSILRMISLETGEITNLSSPNWNISDYKWIPGQRKIIVSATESIFPELLTNKVYQLDIESKKMTEIASPVQPFSGLNLSPDGKKIAFRATRADGPNEMDIYLMNIDGTAITNLTAEAIDRTIVNFIWSGNSGLLALAQNGFKSDFYTISINAKVEKMNIPEINPSGTFAFDSETLIFTAQSFTKAAEIYISDDFMTVEKISDFNKHWDTLNFIEPEIVTYKSFDKTSIEASLYKPPDYRKDQKYKAVIIVHGGPSGRFSERFNTWAQLLAGKGFIVLCPNIRGSTAYGYEFMSSNRYDWGGGDFKDVMAGADYLVETGLVDPGLLGIGGWSYGGYMSAWAVTQTNRFKAAVSGAPVIDLAFEYGAETGSINAYDSWYLGTPYENLDDFIRMSPVTYVKNVKTPTLLLCGENDVIDPIEQCSQFYRGLKRYGVETRFVRYPREGHGIREEKHRIDLLIRMISWFEDYVK